MYIGGRDSLALIVYRTNAGLVRGEIDQEGCGKDDGSSDYQGGFHKIVHTPNALSEGSYAVDVPNIPAYHPRVAVGEMLPCQGYREPRARIAP